MRRLGASLCAVLLTVPLAAQAPIAELVQQLGSGNGQQRNAAYRKLMADRAPELIPQLGKAIDGLPRIGQELSCNLLRVFPRRDVAPVYKKMMASTTPYLRVVATARLLADYTSDSDRGRRKRTLKVLTEALAACKPNRLLRAVSACGNIREEAVFAQMRQRLRPAPAHVTRGLLRQLLNWERGVSDQTQAAAAKLLAATEPQVQGVAHAYLLHADASRSAEFAKLLKAKPGVLWNVLDLLPRDKLDAVLLDAIAEALAKPRSEHDIRRLAGVLRSAPQKLKSVLQALVGHEKDKFRDEALAQLANLPGGFGEKDLIAMLHDEAMAVRVVAAGALRKRDNRAGLQPVLDAAKVRGKHQADAARVLGDYRCKQGVPVLLDLLDAKDVRVRNAAWSGLQETLRGLYPYRKFEFRKCGYAPNAASRQNGIATLRAWWASVE